MSILEIQYCNRDHGLCRDWVEEWDQKLRENQHLDCVTRLLATHLSLPLTLYQHGEPRQLGL